MGNYSAEALLKGIYDKMPSIGSGEDHIGEVSCPAGGAIIIPVITTAAYHANDVIGTKYELQDVARLDGKSAILVSMAFYDLAKQRPAVNVVFFDRNPSNGTYTNHAALDIDDADLPYYVGHVEIAQTDWLNTLADNAVGTKRQIALEMFPYATSLWVVMQVTGTPTFASASDLKFIFSFVE